MTLNNRILAGAIVGILFGVAFTRLGPADPFTTQGLYLCGLIGTVFISLLKMVLVPLIFTSIVVGVANLRAHAQWRRVWITTLVFSLTTLSLSILVGLTAANVFAPGKGLTLDMFRNATQHFDAAHLTLPEFFSKFLGNLFQNPVNAMAQGNVLAIVVFALFMGIGLAAGGARYTRLREVMVELFDLTMRMTGWIMTLAPFGVMALLAKLVAGESPALLASLGEFIAVVIGTTLFHGIVVLPLILWLVTRLTPWRFWRGARPALVTAFATSSSAATMPVTMTCLEKDLGVSPGVTGFVVPLGAHLNMDGTALYEAAAALFVAHLCGIELSLGQQLVVCFTTMLASVGAPGIPSAGMVTMIMVLQSVGLPAEAVAILLPIDRILDTVRTMVNVEGDMVSCLVVQRIAGDDAPA